MKKLQTVLDALEGMAQEPVAYVVALKGRPISMTVPVNRIDELAAMHNAPLYAAPVAVQAVPAVCEWKQDTQYENGDTYYSACGEAWVFNDGGPTENRISYCQGCGGKVKLAAAPVAKGEV